MARKSSTQSGFTLIELMVALVIVGILVAIALPTYRDKVLKAHRTEAKTALLDIAGREERFYNTSNPPAYSATASDVGYTGAFPQTVGSGYYTVTITINSATLPLPNYILVATSTGTQTKDTPCATFQLTSQGVQTSAPNTTACWQ